MLFSLSNTALLALALALQTVSGAAIPEIEAAQVAGKTFTNAEGITYTYSSKFKETTLANGAKVTTYYPEASPNPAETVKRDLSKRDGWNVCGNSTFNNKSSPGSPYAGDCWNVYNQARDPNNDDVFTIGGPSWHVLFRSGTCLFAAYATNAPPFGVGVGNGDVADLTRDSINRFQWFDKIGAEGHMNCKDAFNQDKNIEWAIFHT